MTNLAFTHFESVCGYLEWRPQESEDASLKKFAVEAFGFSLREVVVGRDGIEPPTRAFSRRCSTD
jgi:hypothetical protein